VSLDFDWTPNRAIDYDFDPVLDGAHGDSRIDCDRHCNRIHHEEEDPCGPEAVDNLWVEVVHLFPTAADLHGDDVEVDGPCSDCPPEVSHPVFVLLGSYGGALVSDLGKWTCDLGQWNQMISNKLISIHYSNKIVISREMKTLLLLLVLVGFLMLRMVHDFEEGGCQQLHRRRGWSW